MKAYATTGGLIFWGSDSKEIVSRMRRSVFFESYADNEDYMRRVVSRLEESLRSGEIEPPPNEDFFISLLVDLEYLTEVTEDFSCPIAQTFCNSKRGSCAGKNAYCWLRKQEQS